MNIQIIGIRKSPDTRKAERFFKERGKSFHFVDLNERTLSRGEIENITLVLGAGNLIDENSKEFKKRGMAFMQYDPVEEVLEHPLLLRIPVVRFGNNASVGYTPEVWESWIEEPG